ncbi:MAG: RNA polymerase sigma factor [Candidatus Yanofskybacteria bacterium]|nr:RNA polymerase sigma factor [Candidatus Yanofskybacteria bacterium]
MELDDRELVVQCQQGNLEQFALLYDRYSTALYAFIYSKTHHKETAEDLTSTVFFKALNHIQEFDADKGFFRAWLYRIARNSVIDHYRTRKVHGDIEDAWDVPEDSDFIRDLDIKSKLGQVQVYLKDLKPDEREVITSRLWHDFSYREIAEMLGKTEASCKMLFSRSMRKLREQLDSLAYAK